MKIRSWAMMGVALSLVTKSAIPALLPIVLLVMVWVRQQKEASLRKQQKALERRLEAFRGRFQEAVADLLRVRAGVHALSDPPNAETEGEYSSTLASTVPGLLLSFDGVVAKDEKRIGKLLNTCQKIIDEWDIKKGEGPLNEVKRILEELDGMLEVFRGLKNCIGPKAQASAVKAYEAAVLPSRDKLVRRVQECCDAVEKLKKDGANISKDFSALLEGAVTTFDGQMRKKRDWPAASIRADELLSQLNTVLSLHRSMHEQFGVRRYEVANVGADLKKYVARFEMWEQDGYPSQATHATMLDFAQRLDALRGVLEAELGNPGDYRKPLEKLVHEMCAYVTTQEVKHQEWLVGEFRKNGNAVRSKLSQLLIPLETALRNLRQDFTTNSQSFTTAEVNVIRSMVVQVEKIRDFYQVDLVMALSTMSTMDDRDVALVAEWCAESIGRLEEFRDVTSRLINTRRIHATASFPAARPRGAENGTLN